MYRRINPSSRRELPLRMLFQPAGPGLFNRACEADSFRGLVAAIIDDRQYETADAEGRLMQRLQLARDLVLLTRVEGRSVSIGDMDGPEMINVASDEPLIRSLDRLGYVSLEPDLKDTERRRQEGDRYG
jgi:hypothetical protein